MADGASSTVASKKRPVSRVVAIIGASGGIGAAIAERISQDAAVTLGYFRSEAQAAKLAQKIQSSGGQASTHQVNTTDHHSVQAFLQAVETQWGWVDSIVVATGPTIPICPVVDVSYEMFRDIIDTEVIGSFNVVKSGVELLRKQPVNNKSILFVLSAALMRTLEFDGMSYIPKMAVEGLIRQTVRDIGKEGIRLNGIGTGGFDAGMGERVDLTNERVCSLLKDIKTPLGRMGSGLEIANVAAFLISDAATYVSGQILGVDGGYSA
ncbi:NAD(P)-binding protein [Lepidopterella palustris CBS 459.81]|uniref:NAD(P)-binding protein n=1 Tax=Lepidopterella palustris CBS 459.81 TaxID=1314670 RepID=A0A8E2E6A1_9PEZI|nr:NAD(P)-binding protein [Lepidopterella palustris CBS 459.81]